MLSDPKAAMAQLTPLLRQRMTGTQKDAAKQRLESERESRLQERRSLETRTAEDDAKEPMSALVLMREIAHALPADAVVVNESVTAGGTLRAWLNSRMKKASSRPREVGSGSACQPWWGQAGAATAPGRGSTRRRQCHVCHPGAVDGSAL